jgi:outer membrane receptor protein involved in Fe transport
VEVTAATDDITEVSSGRDAWPAELGDEIKQPSTTTQAAADKTIQWDADGNRISPSRVLLAQATEDAPAPAAPNQPTTQPQTPDTESSNNVSFDLLNDTVLAGLNTYINAASTLGAGLNKAFVESRTDATSLMQDLPGVAFERRTQISNAPILQGRRLGQVPAQGSYWFPARQDMDTVLGKIDSRIVEQFTIIKGPYSALYGPGLSFYDVDLLGSPRYLSGFESHGSTSAEYKTNGDQWSGRHSVWGGGSDWGFRVGAGMRVGNDYFAGDGTTFPSSYKSGSADVALGADLSANSSIEFNYIRVNENDVEIPNQYFDINALVTDAYDITYVVENQRNFDQMTFETWYNRTAFTGDNLRPGKRSLLMLDNPFGVSLFGETDVDASSRGYSLAFDWGNERCGLLTIGSDLRYLAQELNEFNMARSFFGDIEAKNTIPNSHSSNPGLFIQASRPLTSRLNVTTGARVDWVSANADRTVDDIDGGVIDIVDELGGELDQHFNLWSAFVTSDLAVTENLTFTVGGGHAMRAPSMLICSTLLTRS